MKLRDALVLYRCWKAYIQAGKAQTKELTDVVEAMVALGDRVSALEARGRK